MINASDFLQRHGRKRIAAWMAVLVLCIALSGCVLVSAGSIAKTIKRVSSVPYGEEQIVLEPGEKLMQSFPVRGRAQGLWLELYLDMAVPEGYQGDVSVTLKNLTTNHVHYQGDHSPARLAEGVGISLKEIFLPSGDQFAIILKNNTDTMIGLGYDPSVQSGTLTVDGEPYTGYLNYAADRIFAYEPSVLFYLVLLAANVTVLTGTWLVLFTDIKVHMLYLVLAAGFGFCMLFDLTPLYGFDMRFQFDSAYVVSNEMLGLGGLMQTQSLANPEKTTVSYYRRYGDDYHSYCFYFDDYVSANYTDTYWGLSDFRAAEKDKELILTETFQGAVGEQLYLYLPQAVGFTISRLLGLGFYPMLQLARVLTYGFFVLMTFLAIRQAPFGKRLLMLTALLPAAMVQTVSITRDAVILGLCFYLTGKVLAVAYGEGMPRKRDWATVMVVSVLLAPCKMVYLPVSFLWLLVVYRKYIREQGMPWRKAVGLCGVMMLPVLGFFLLSSLGSIANISQTEKPGLYNETAYSLRQVLSNPGLLLHLLINTYRNHLGSYLVNAIQLFDIRLGSSEGITLAFLFLLVLEVSSREEGRSAMRMEERGFIGLLFLGVLGLLTLAAIQWTPNTSSVILGFQGRYLLPALPLAWLALFENPLLKTGSHGGTAVKLGCCVMPGIALANMYLWTATAMP